MRAGHQSRSRIMAIRERLLSLVLVRVIPLLHTPLMSHRGMHIRRIRLRIIRGLLLGLRAVRATVRKVAALVVPCPGVVLVTVRVVALYPGCVWVGTVPGHARAATHGRRGAVSAELGHVGRGGVEGAYAVGGTAQSVSVLCGRG